MKTRHGWVGVLAALVLVASVTVAMAQGGGGGGGPRTADSRQQPKLVTLDLKGVPLRDAVEAFLKASDLSVVIIGDLPMEPKVTMRLKDADALNALELLARLGQLGFSGTVPLAGGPVAALAAMPERRPLPSSGRGEPAFPVAANGDSGFVPQSLPEATSTLNADLEVKDVPLREAIAALDQKLPIDRRQVRIVVDPSVREDIRVTAQVRKMPLAWVLKNIVQQAHLTYTVQRERDPEVILAEAERRGGGMPWSEEDKRAFRNDRDRELHTIYILPVPLLEVTMPGRGGGGGGGGIGSGPRGGGGGGGGGIGSRGGGGGGMGGGGGG